MVRSWRLKHGVVVEPLHRHLHNAKHKQVWHSQPATWRPNAKVWTLLYCSAAWQLDSKRFGRSLCLPLWADEDGVNSFLLCVENCSDLQWIEGSEFEIKLFYMLDSSTWNLTLLLTGLHDILQNTIHSITTLSILKEFTLYHIM
jgi:hypothetical protein